MKKTLFIILLSVFSASAFSRGGPIVLSKKPSLANENEITLNLTGLGLARMSDEQGLNFVDSNGTQVVSTSCSDGLTIQYYLEVTDKSPTGNGVVTAKYFYTEPKDCIKLNDQILRSLKQKPKSIKIDVIKAELTNIDR